MKVIKTKYTNQVPESKYTQVLSKKAIFVGCYLHVVKGNTNSM